MASESARLELPATSRIAPLLVAADRCIAPISLVRSGDNKMAASRQYRRPRGPPDFAKCGSRARRLEEPNLVPYSPCAKAAGRAGGAAPATAVSGAPRKATIWSMLVRAMRESIG